MEVPSIADSSMIITNSQPSAGRTYNLLQAWAYHPHFTMTVIN